MIRIAFFDIDGTLYEMGHPYMSQSTLYALTQLKKKGIKIIIATGRSPLRMPHLPIKFDGYIHFNGQFCLIDNKIIYECCLQKNEVKTIIENASNMDKAVGLAGLQFFGCNFYDERLAGYLKNTRPDYPLLEDFKDYAAKEIFQMVIPISKEEEKTLFKGTQNCKAVRWSSMAADIIPKQGGKHIGIQKVLDYYHISDEEAIAFGDGENDIPMLKMVGCGVAMGNASSLVKEAADYCTDKVQEDGILKALQHLKIIE